jgi:hypothetical protein
MTELSTYTSWREIDSHTERALLFSDGTEVFGRAFQEFVGDIQSMVDSESLTIRALTDGIERVEGEDRRLFDNSVWVVDYDVLLGSNTYEPLCALLGAPLFPETTRVIVFVEGSLTRTEVSDKLDDELKIQIPEGDIAVSRLVLEGMLRNYFQMVNPERGDAGKREIFSWVEDVRRVI